MADDLARALYGVPPTDDPIEGEVTLLARTDGITRQMADTWRETAPLIADPAPNGHTLGVFLLPNRDFVVAKAWIADNTPRYLYTGVPAAMMRERRGNLAALIDAPLPYVNGSDELAMLHVSPVMGWTTEERAALVGRLIEQFETGEGILSLLNAALSPERLLIHNHNGDSHDRLAVVMGLMALLPPCARADLTFSTRHPDTAISRRGRVVFGANKTSPRWVVDWEQREVALSEREWSPYVNLLAKVWDDDLGRLFDALDRIDPLGDCHRVQEDQIEVLDEMVERYTFYMQVEANAVVRPDDLKAALSDGERLPLAWSRRYAELLLPHALENRDTEADSLIARQMDIDPELDDQLGAQMKALLNEMPDLVYVFVRQRLGEGVTDRWLVRLHDAAEQSLWVALDSEEPSLILSWLRLLAREPRRFLLGDVVQRGMQASLPFAARDAEFAMALLVLSARFVAEMIDPLIDDPDFVKGLPETARLALTEFDRDDLAELQDHSTSLFLVGMGRAAAAHAGDAFEAGALERVLALHAGERKFNLNSPYVPLAVLRICAETGADWLSANALETMLAATLVNRDDDLFPTLTGHLAERNQLAAHLAGALHRAGCAVNQSLDTIAILTASGKLKAIDALTVYVQLLERQGWNETTQPFMEAVGRLLHHNPEATLPKGTVMKLLETAATLRDESIIRAAAITMLQDLARGEDVEAFAEGIKQVFSQLAWSTTARPTVIHWWRNFVQSQSTTRLIKLEALLEGSRVTDDVLTILRSVLAVRRMMGKRDVSAFAEAVNTTYNVLEMMTTAFEVGERSSTRFDPVTVRLSLMQMHDTLSPHERQILSNSLKELAGLIARIGDNRTKAGLIGRSKDNLDRSLMSGEQSPQGAVDAMKWMAGFFAGSQAPPDDEA